MTEKITDKERQTVILDMAHVNSDVITFRSKLRNAQEDADILKKKLLPYYRDVRRFQERMEKKYELTKNQTRLQEKMEEIASYEKSIFVAGAQIIINYLNQYYEAKEQEWSYNHPDATTFQENAKTEYAMGSLEDKLEKLRKQKDFISFDFSYPWKEFYSLSLMDGNLQDWFKREGYERDRNKNRIIFSSPDEGCELILSQKMAEDFNVIVMSVTEDILAMKHAREERERLKAVSAKEARRALYYKLKQEFEGETN